ncbi:MAG: prepilin-type N-terminal cleavage/methylation domain-containing protein [Planctomycetota bacterium]
MLPLLPASPLPLPAAPALATRPGRPFWLLQPSGPSRFSRPSKPARRIRAGRIARRGYTLIELIVIIVLISVGTTLILALHTHLERESLALQDEKSFETFRDQMQRYSQKYTIFPAVENFQTEADRAARFADFRRNPGKAVRILLRMDNPNDDISALQTLYSPMDGEMPPSVAMAMQENTTLSTRENICYSSYAYDPGHAPSDGDTVIFGHSPSFQLRHGMDTLEVLTASLQVRSIRLNPDDSAYEITYPVQSSTGAAAGSVTDQIFKDQSAKLGVHDSYLTDAIPFEP